MRGMLVPGWCKFTTAGGSSKRRRNPAFLSGFARLGGHAFADLHPFLVGHGVVGPGLKRLAAESLLFPERMVAAIARSFCLG